MQLVATLIFFEMTQRKFQGKVLSKKIYTLVKNLESVLLLHHMMVFPYGIMYQLLETFAPN